MQKPEDILDWSSQLQRPVCVGKDLVSRLGFGLGLGYGQGQGLSWDGVRVRCWIIYYTNERPYKDRSISVHLKQFKQLN